jgi:hypothetical protein
MCHKITGRCFTPEDKRSGRYVCQRIFLDPVIERDYVEKIEMLAV